MYSGSNTLISLINFSKKVKKFLNFKIVLKLLIKKESFNPFQCRLDGNKTSLSFNMISDLPFEYIPISLGSAKTPLDLLFGYVPSKFLIGKFC